MEKGWLNHAFLVPHEKHILLDLSHLKVYIPAPDYLLAMKVLSARADTMDREDIVVLLRGMKLKTADEVIEIVKSYYPHKQVKASARIHLEEILKEAK